ncbi:peroxisomal biogenesis factor 19-like [Amphiura filiformis]|uniref:peroxisomal biogenesis factor 19-like n=1 Tax=Amphiura filiformis TaxID=82378 RepID=UPI003B21224B
MGAAADFQNALGDLMSELGKEFSQDPQFNDELSKLLQTTIPPGAMPQSSASTSSSTPSSAAPSGSTAPSSNTEASPSNEDDMARTLGETLNRLSQNAQELQQDSGMTGDFMRAFEGMNMGGGDGDAELLPMMQSIMQNLLAKEVLYPSLKEVVGKYPEWLTEKKDSIPQSDHDRYSKQLEVMQRLCTEYEAETDSDSTDVKQQRTMRVMDLIQQMESLGQPPPDIVGDMGPGFQFDEDGSPRIPGMIPGMPPGMMPPGMPNPEQCSIM